MGGFLSERKTDGTTKQTPVELAGKLRAPGGTKTIRGHLEATCLVSGSYQAVSCSVLKQKAIVYILGQDICFSQGFLGRYIVS